MHCSTSGIAVEYAPASTSSAIVSSRASNRALDVADSCSAHGGHRRADVSSDGTESTEQDAQRRDRGMGATMVTQAPRATTGPARARSSERASESRSGS